MRAGGCAVQQTLTSEAASVLKHSLTLARRRGHAQVTPLHVAATLLSSRSSLLRRACLKSQPPNNSHHLHYLNNNNLPLPLHCRALELCFNVALNRLPTTPGPLLHGQPSLSNALIAALKRAQAHQRRGCVEQQQQPLLTIKVELEQLIISILDDPSVSRVMREAGFSSTAVKTNVEDAASTSSLFHCYSPAAAGIFSSPCSPDYSKDQQNPNHTSAFWQTHFLSYSDRTNNHHPLLFSSLSTSPPPQKKPLPVPEAAVQETGVKLVLHEVLTTRKNTVVVGNAAESVVLEVMGRVERGEGTEEELMIKFVKLTPVVLMKRADVEMNVSELKRKVDSTLATASCGGAVIYVGDLKWTVEMSLRAGEYNPADDMVGEVARLVTEYNNNGNKKKVWLMGTASHQTYVASCQMRRPSLELQWALRLLSLPCSLTLRANPIPSVLDSKIGLSETKDDQLCVECKSGYKKEVQLLKSSNRHKLLPPWLQPQPQDTIQKDELAEVRKKWNRLCQGLHQNVKNSNQRMYGRSYSYNSSYPWWPTTTIPTSNSISFVDSPSNTNLAPRFRRQECSTIEFNLGSGHKPQELSLDCLRSSTQGKEVRVTLELGYSEQDKSCSDGLYNILLDNVPWQSETIWSVVEAISDHKSSNKESWLLIQGNDSVGKRRLAHAIAESICGSSDLVLHMNMRKRADEAATPSSEILGRALGNHDKLVILVEDVDLADAEFMKFLADGFETGNLGESWSKRKGKGSSCRAVFVLTKSDGQDWKRDQDSVIQMTLSVTQTTLSPGFKRKAEEESDSLSKMARKSTRIEEADGGNTKKGLSRQQSFNTLDLNIRAIELEEEGEEESEEKAGELSSISSDLTRETALEHSNPNGFLEAIKNRFVFNRMASQEQETRHGVMERIKGSFEEVFEGGERVRFSVEERVVGEVVEGSGTFVDSSFEKWLKDVFQTSLRRVKNGGKGEGIGIKMKLCYGGKGKQGEGVLWDGFMGSSLPKNIHVVSSLD